MGKPLEMIVISSDVNENEGRTIMRVETGTQQRMVGYSIPLAVQIKSGDRIVLEGFRTDQNRVGGFTHDQYNLARFYREDDIPYLTLAASDIRALEKQHEIQQLRDIATKRTIQALHDWDKDDPGRR
ncbi:MAG: hypothetical protein AABX51_01210 [Nanoarchaeota archaeon]